MNRRDFLRSLAAIPLLGFLKPEAGEAPEVFFDIIEDTPPPHQFVTKLAIGPDDVIYVGGAFIEEDIEQVRQRHYDYEKLLRRVIPAD